MIKECHVIMSNEFFTVVKFGENEIQLPCTSISRKTVDVKYENGVYSVVDHDDNNMSDNNEQQNINQFYSVTTFEDKKKTINDEDYKQQ